MAQRLLLIEQNAVAIGTGLHGMLTAEGGFSCERASWGSLRPEALRDCAAQLVMPVAVPETAKAMQLFEWLRHHPIATPTLAVLPCEADEALLQTAAEAVDDFVFWPLRKGELRHRLRRILGPPGHDVASVRRRLAEEAGLSQLVGNDPAFADMVQQLPLIARSDSPVLITGETGTGKELCARAIHHLGKRRHGPFVALDCGAVPDHLFENELFGHARGAFTDAHRDQKGVVAMAEGGTLFLDEIDALSSATQAKLLRFLQEHTFKPLGGERLVHADVTVIVATNRDLDLCVRKGQFRSDLYFRINILRLHLPPLRDRRGDIGLLAKHFLEALRKPTDLIQKSFSGLALRQLALYDWPGNVRELCNVVQRAVALSEGSHIRPCSLSLPDAAPAAPAASFKDAHAAFERLFVEQLLHKHHGNITRAAIEAQKDRRAFGRLVKKYGIDRAAAL
jgi:DNA-binding NtrC family response regulator